jgi:ComF family protein
MIWQDHLAIAGRALLDLLYPPRCPGCGRMGQLFCAACQTQIAPYTGPAGLSDPSPLSSVQTTAAFSGPLRQAIHALKYGHVRALAQPLGSRMSVGWPAWPVPPDLILPVPLHSRRQRERGYNQSALLAEVVGKDLSLPVHAGLLRRSRATRPQVGLDAVARRANVAGAFTCRGNVVGRRIVLVDDVCTTGATLEACAEALRAAGAAEVWGYTLARASWEPDGEMGDAGTIPYLR